MKQGVKPDEPVVDGQPVIPVPFPAHVQNIVKVNGGVGEVQQNDHHLPVIYCGGLELEQPIGVALTQVTVPVSHFLAVWLNDSRISRDRLGNISEKRAVPIGNNVVPLSGADHFSAPFLPTY